MVIAAARAGTDAIAGPPNWGLDGDTGGRIAWARLAG
jgi:hypothetical protein